MREGRKFECAKVLYGFINNNVISITDFFFFFCNIKLVNFIKGLVLHIAFNFYRFKEK